MCRWRRVGVAWGVFLGFHSCQEEGCASFFRHPPNVNLLAGFPLLACLTAQPPPLYNYGVVAGKTGNLEPAGQDRSGVPTSVSRAGPISVPVVMTSVVTVSPSPLFSASRFSVQLSVVEINYYSPLPSPISLGVLVAVLCLYSLMSSPGLSSSVAHGRLSVNSTLISECTT